MGDHLPTLHAAATNLRGRPAPAGRGRRRAKAPRRSGARNRT
jgi:hypothetical protein